MRQALVVLLALFLGGLAPRALGEPAAQPKPSDDPALAQIMARLDGLELQDRLLDLHLMELNRDLLILWAATVLQLTPSCSGSSNAGAEGQQGDVH